MSDAPPADGEDMVRLCVKSMDEDDGRLKAALEEEDDDEDDDDDNVMASLEIVLDDTWDRGGEKRNTSRAENHGCFKASAAVMRVLSSTSRQREMRFMTSSLAFDHNGAGKDTCFVRQREAGMKGGDPARHLYSRIPNAHTSVALPYGCCLNISGAE